MGESGPAVRLGLLIGRERPVFLRDWLLAGWDGCRFEAALSVDVVVAWRVCTRHGDGNSELKFLSMGLGCGFFTAMDGMDRMGFYGMDGGDGWGFWDLGLDSGLRRNDGKGAG